MSGLFPGLALAAFAAVLVLASAAWIRRQRRRGPSSVRHRPAFGRLRVDPQYVRDRFAEIVKHTPELGGADPRLLGLYVIPPANEEG